VSLLVQDLLKQAVDTALIHLKGDPQVVVAPDRELLRHEALNSRIDTPEQVFGHVGKRLPKGDERVFSTPRRCQSPQTTFAGEAQEETEADPPSG